jgi:hypothetical protein
MFRFDLLLVFVVVAIQAQQFPITAILRVIVVVVVAVVHGQFTQVGVAEFAGATSTNPRVQFQGLFAVAFGAFIRVFAGIQDNFGVIWIHGFPLTMMMGLLYTILALKLDN